MRSRTPPREEGRSSNFETPSFRFGDHVRVLHSFGHAVGNHYDITAGMLGVVSAVDPEGDVRVQFANLSLAKWIVGDERFLLEVIYAANFSSSANEGRAKAKAKVRATPQAYQDAESQQHPQPLLRPKWNVLDNRPIQNPKPVSSATPVRAVAPNTVASPARAAVSNDAWPNLSAVEIADPDELSRAIQEVAAQITAVPGTVNTSLSLTFHVNNVATVAAFHAKFQDMGIHIDEMTRAGVPTSPKQVPWAAVAGDAYQPCLLVTFSTAPKEQKVSFQCRLRRSIITAKGKRAAISANLERVVAFLGKPSEVAASNPAVAREVSSRPISIVDMLRQSHGEGFQHAR